MKIKPTWKQFKKWSLPSKASVLGLPLAIVLFFLGLLLTNYCFHGQSIVMNLWMKRIFL